MSTCLCLRSASTSSSKIHTNNNADIYKYEIDSVPIGFFCVIRDEFTSRIHYFPHTMGSMSYINTIHTPPQPSPDASMNVIYDGSSDTSSVQLVGSAAESCSSCCIISTDCLTAVDFLAFPIMVIVPVIHLLAIIAPLYMVYQWLCGVISPWQIGMFWNIISSYGSCLLGIEIFFMFIWC